MILVQFYEYFLHAPRVMLSPLIWRVGSTHGSHHRAHSNIRREKHLSFFPILYTFFRIQAHRAPLYPLWGPIPFPSIAYLFAHWDTRHGYMEFLIGLLNQILIVKNLVVSRECRTWGRLIPNYFINSQQTLIIFNYFLLNIWYPNYSQLNSHYYTECCIFICCVIYIY